MDEEHNTLKQVAVEDIESMHPFLAPIDPPQVTKTLLIIPFL